MELRYAMDCIPLVWANSFNRYRIIKCRAITVGFLIQTVELVNGQALEEWLVFRATAPFWRPYPAKKPPTAIFC